MADAPLIGPFRVLDAASGTPVPWYMMPFDQAGQSTAPETRAALMRAAQSGGFTDIFLFSHGWNNTWDAASANYERFMSGYADMVRRRGLTYPRPFQPLLVGVYWPSIEFIRTDEEPPIVRGLDADEGGQADLAAATDHPDAAWLSSDVAAGNRERFTELANRDRLTEGETLEMARMLLPAYQAGGVGVQEIPSEGNAISAEAIVDLWRQTLAMGTPGGPAPAEEAPPAGDRGLIADILSFDPRDILRVVTFLKMKDRAGVVGVTGVAPLLADLLRANDATRVHLLGHSYGCRVVLSALCAAPLSRQVNSALLLQPAVSCMCFADDILDTGQQGGFRVALERVEQPILVTYSRRDLPLHNLYQLAVRRPGDVGEISGDRGLETPPDPHAALGGYGPLGCAGECDDMPMPEPGAGYSLPAGARVVGLDGTRFISGHSDISNAATWWALYSQVAAQ